MLILLHDTHCAGDLAAAADSASTADDDEGAGTDRGIVGPKLEAFLSMMKSPSTTTQLGRTDAAASARWNSIFKTMSCMRN